MNTSFRKILTFAGSKVEIDIRGPRSAEILDRLFELVSASRAQASPADLTLQDNIEDSTFTLYCGSDRLYRGDSTGGVAATLLHVVLNRLADQCTEGLMLHAGAVACGNGCLLLPGVSGVGKTTLTAWFVDKGFDYLTDELAYVPRHSNEVQGLSRPLSVKTSAHTVLRRYTDIDVESAGVFRTSSATLIPARLLKRQHGQIRPRLVTIIFPSYRAQSEFELAPLTSAEAGMRLMGSVLNARNLPGHGFDEVTYIVRSVAAHQLSYSSLAQVAANFESVRQLLSGRQHFNMSSS